MVKTKIYRRRRNSSQKAVVKRAKSKVIKKEQEERVMIREGVKLREYNPIKNLMDPNKIGAAIMQCLMENDTNGVLEILGNYLYALNKSQFFKEAKVPRSTVYNFMKNRNPTLKTLAKILHTTIHH